MEIGKICWSGTDPIKRIPLPKLIYKPQTKKLIDITNKIINLYITYQSNLEDIHAMIYIAATAVLICNKQKPFESNIIKEKCIIRKPKWQTRIEDKIVNLLYTRHGKDGIKNPTKEKQQITYFKQTKKSSTRRSLSKKM